MYDTTLASDYAGTLNYLTMLTVVPIAGQKD